MNRNLNRGNQIEKDIGLVLGNQNQKNGKKTDAENVEEKHWINMKNSKNNQNRNMINKGKKSRKKRNQF